MLKFSQLLFYSIMFISHGSYCQSRTVTIQWESNEEFLFNNEILYRPKGKNIEYDNGLPVLFFKEKVNTTGKRIQINEVQSVPCSPQDIMYFKKCNLTVSSNPEIDFGIKNEKHRPYISMVVKPFYIKKNKMMKIQSFSFELVESVDRDFLKEFVTESVLREGSGSWYKLQIERDGIYKIDYSLLQSLGLDPSSISPNSMHVYGNGDGMLPELNSMPRKDDLMNNYIEVVGGGDGSFDENDYILFYGAGPHKWSSNGTVEFDRKQHLYSDYSYYFLNINSTTPPLRIENVIDTNGIVDFVIDSYDYRDIYEKELVNLVSAGQRWYGEQFDVNLNQTFNFVIPNIDTNAVRFKTSIATNCKLSTGTSQQYSINGLVLSNDPLPSVGVDYIRSSKSFEFLNPSETIPLNIQINRNNPSTVVYLDRILLNARRKLNFWGNQMGFRNLTQASNGQIANYQLSNFPLNGFVWDISNVNKPMRVNGNLSNGVYSFLTNFTYKEYIASNGNNFYEPIVVGEIFHQNVHALPIPNHLIITDETLISEAERLADLHRSEGKIVHVVTDEQIFNEFSSGAPDATAFRMICKMFYDREQNSGENNIETLLLFGDGTFDPKNRVPNNNNLILTYQVPNSENHISALVTDDYFGMLDDNEAINSSDLLDIGIGRIIASDLNQAKQQVNKIEHYMKNGSELFNAQQSNCCMGEQNGNTFGDWRLKYVQIADDEENGYFINQDTEPQYQLVKENNYSMNCDKLYLDAYPQEVTAGGQRYPDVFESITNRVQRGALIINYVGHGGEVGLAEERVVTIPQINNWTNINNMHLFVSATCEFTKYDDPSRVSAGEWLSLNPNGGAIALMTTTRSVFFGVNSVTGRKFYSNVFSRDNDNLPLTFGEIVRRTKNESGTSENKRSFTLIGDPALKIALPRWKVVTDSINGKNTAIYEDTLRALSLVNVKGHIEDFSGNEITDFNGVLIPSIYDKPKTLVTLGQDPESPQIEYELQRNIVYKGKSTVSNGKFEFSFIVPKDIDLSIGRGKISYYANNGLSDCQGFDTLFRIGGIDPNGIADNIGPEISLFMNDLDFVSGSITDENPVLIVKTSDESGINTVGTGIGHDITAILDDNSSEPIVLNDYYSSDIDSYTTGEIRYPLTNLEVGNHNLKVKIWDVNNNSSNAEIDFQVLDNENVEITRLYNYPNPFTTNTEFMFEHNQSCSQLEVMIQVLTVSGKVVRNIYRTVPTDGFRVSSIFWDGKDDYGQQIGKGVYVYRCKIQTPDGRTAEKIEKLAILK